MSTIKTGDTVLAIQDQQYRGRSIPAGSVLTVGVVEKHRYIDGTTYFFAPEGEPLSEDGVHWTTLHCDSFQKIG